MIASKSLLLSIAIAYVEARFGQEQVPISAISAVQGGAPGAAATIAGAAISDLLGAANACAKLVRADQVVTELGGGADAIAAAIGLVTAEKNTNPFANGNVQNVCGDASLPATQELRGITPLIDPAVDVNGAVAALSQQTAGAPLNADGLSVFDLLVQAGLGDLVQAQNGAGGAAAGGNQNQNNNNNQQNNNNNNNNQQNNNNNNNQQNNNNNNADAAASACAAAPAETAAAGNANQNQNNNNNNNNNNNQAGGAAGGNVVGAADFGKCTPTITFQGGEGNRPATEFTFQIADPIARGGQGEALNPNIITNALCNQLTNVCGANQAAIDVCLAAKAKVAALNTRNKATADTFNTAIGFPGAITNPAGGPADVPAAAAAKRALRLRALEFRA